MCFGQLWWRNRFVEREKSISLSEVKCIVCRFPIGGAEYILQYSIFSALYCKMWFDAILPEIWRKYVYEIEAMRVAISLPCKWKMWSIEPQSEIFPKWCNATTALIPHASFSRVEDIFVQFRNIFLRFEKHQILISQAKLLDKMIPSDPNGQQGDCSYINAFLFPRFQ